MEENTILQMETLNFLPRDFPVYNDLELWTVAFDYGQKDHGEE